MSKGAQIAIGGTLVVLLLGWFAATNVETFRYYETLEEFKSAGGESQAARVHGYVVDGSIERDLQGRRVHFAVQNDPPHAGVSSREPLRVVYTSLETPDLFKGGAEVVIEGRLHRKATGAVFEATNVLAKCPSKFQAERPEAGGAPDPSGF